MVGTLARSKTTFTHSSKDHQIAERQQLSAQHPPQSDGNAVIADWKKEDR